MLAALAAGSAVIIKPAPQVQRCAAVMVEALWAAGVPREVLHFVDVPENELGQPLISHPAVDRVVLTGAFETAALFRSWRPDLPVLAETSGKNAIIVTPSADFDLAAADIAKSAFGHAGQKCSAASLAILVGSVADSRALRAPAAGCRATMKVGLPTDPVDGHRPAHRARAGQAPAGTDRAGGGGAWLVQPRALDDGGRAVDAGRQALGCAGQRRST